MAISTARRRRRALTAGLSALTCMAVALVTDASDAVGAVSTARSTYTPAASSQAVLEPQWEPIQTVDSRRGLASIRSETSTGGTSTITWEDLGIETSCTQLYRSVRRPAEEQWSAYEQVGRAHGGTARTLVAGDDDASVVTWTSCNSRRVKLQRLRDDGWGRLRVVKTPSGTTALPAAPNDVHGVAVVWASNSGSPTEVGGSYRPKGGPWEPLTPLEVDGADLEHVALTNAGDVIAVMSTRKAYLVSTYRAGAWTTETLPIAEGRVANQSRIASNQEGYLAIGLLVKDRRTLKKADLEVHFRSPGEAFQPPYLLEKKRPCEDYWDECADLDMDAAGNLVALWPTGSRLDDTYVLSRRDAASGEWSQVYSPLKPGYDLEPSVDMHADGTAVAWIDDDYGEEGPLYICPSGTGCVEAAYPADPTPGVFVAGPAGTVTAAFGDDFHCDDWCETEQVNASRLLP